MRGRYRTFLEASCLSLLMVIAGGCGSGFDIPGVDLPLYEEDFRHYGSSQDPAHWYDTAAFFSLGADNNFSVYYLDGNPAFSTYAGSTDIHSHITKEGSSSWSNYRIRVRMRMDVVGTFGVTFYSGYPESDRYYELQSPNGSPVQFVSRNAGGLGGSTSTGFFMATDQWTWVVIEVTNDGSLTRMRAKVWTENTSEPGGWMAEAWDSSGNRIGSGTIGVHASGLAGAHWDDFLVTEL